MKRFRIYYPIFFALIFVGGIFLGMRLTQLKVVKDSAILPVNMYSYNKLSDIIDYIDYTYVDTVNKVKLSTDAINGMLESLDPHSAYIPAMDFNRVNDPLKGNFEGIGIAFRVIKDTVVVLNTISGGPSEKVGIRSGDRIVMVDSNVIAGIKIKNSEIIGQLKGKKGSEVVVGILRKGESELLDYKIIRDVIPTYSVDVAYMADEEIGYIKISTFSATTYKEFKKALKDLKSEGMKKLILDLRANGGGYLNAATKIADEFLSDKKLIVYTEGRKRPVRYFKATAKGDFEKEDVIVLIDDWSASASEIIAGAIQDNDRGTIIGRRSYGKGLVQEQVQLPDGSAVRLTVARYHTPTGRCIQKSYKGGTEEYHNEFYQRFMADGEIENPDTINMPDSLKFTTPGGKTVYGGGGIMPDIYIPVRADSTNRLYNILTNKGIIYRFAFDYTDQNRDNLKRYDDVDDYSVNFKVPQKLFNDLLAHAKEKGIKYSSADIKSCEGKIKLRMKAFIGRNLLGEKAFFPFINMNDPTYLRAVEYLEN